MTLAPIVFFVYNRVDKTKTVISGLKQNPLAKESELYIFSDAPKTSQNAAQVEKVRKFLKEITGFKSVTIIEYEENKGIEHSYYYAFDYIFSKYDKAVILEDDIYPAKHFLDFLNEGLDVYKDEKKVCAIGSCGSNIPVENFTFIKQGATYGWATWKDRYEELFNHDGDELLQGLIKKNMLEEFNDDGYLEYSRWLKRGPNNEDAPWDIRFCASCFLNDKYTLIPAEPLGVNIGFDNTGVHCKKIKGQKTNKELIEGLSDKKFKIKLLDPSEIFQPEEATKKRNEGYEKNRYKTAFDFGFIKKIKDTKLKTRKIILFNRFTYNLESFQLKNLFKAKAAK